MDDDFRRDVQEVEYRLRVNAEARRRHNLREAKDGWTPPALTGSLKNQLAAERTKDEYLIDRLLGVGHNMVIAAQYKVGKTTTGLNVVRSLVDRKDFVGHETSLGDGESVAWVNGEMTQNDFLDYVGPMGIANAAQVKVLHLRGQRLPILDDYVAKWVIKWLKANKARVWAVDSWRRLCTWSGVNENDNPEIERLTERVDWIKSQSGCREFITVAHTGRARVDEGEEHARGATALDDWVDQRWVLTRKQGSRFMYAEGRAGSVPEFTLVHDDRTHLVSAANGNRQDMPADLTRLEKQAYRIGAVARESPGLTTGTVCDRAGITNKEDRSKAMKYAEDKLDVIHRMKRGTSWLVYPVGDDDTPQ